ncbi:MAG: DNA repair protein RecN [bacterium]
MLQSLSIKNYALLADVEIQFGNGLNILTGETGAGKSIIIGALSTILGERVDTTVLRDGTSKAIIEGIFSINGNRLLQNFLIQQNLASEDEQLILRREIYNNARSRAFINDSPVSLSILQTVSDLLVDLHGQHEHQSLLKVPNHLTFLDEFGDFKNELYAIAEAHQKLRALTEDLKQLEQQQKALIEKKEYNSFQINEINKVNPLIDEEEALLKEEKIVKHSERLFNLTNQYYQILYEGENSVYDQISRVEHGLNELQGIDEKFAGYKKDCESVRLTVEELSKVFQNYKSNIVFNPERLEQIQNRISELTGLKKKFGLAIADILKLRDTLQSETENLENMESQVESLKQTIVSEKKYFSQLCLELSQKRKQVAKQLEKLVPDVLSYLGMSNTRFKVVLKYQNDPLGLVSSQGNSYLATATGMDFAEFFVSLNTGEALRPLAKVASGGEISRIMLTLKSIVAKEGQIPVLVFDEIDIGVSGRIAQAVGRKLKELSDIHQVICITHLPQIASMGEHHFSVEKIEKSGRTETLIRKLSPAERTEAIAKLLAGENISETHLNSARELLQDATTN